MYTRHDEVPVLESRDAEVEAQPFNHVQVALKRYGTLRLALPGLRTLELILQPDAWVIVDRALGDLPVAAWVEFDAADRTTLHEPIRCRLRTYHAAAGMVLKQALEQMDGALNAVLGREASLDPTPTVVPMRKGKAGD